ncbi:MAG: amino acid ABC transporter permease [Eubacteriales bacterium]|nr:amino acid ABC transporter permease [Oscillospiraceae bacterium]
MIDLFSRYGRVLVTAMGQTLLLALYGLFFACIIGLIVGIMSVVKNKFCRGFALVFVNLIRGVPMIVLAYFIFFGVPFLFNNVLHVQNRVTLTALQAGSICLALNCGAYMAEIIRAGIQSVDIGQMEAARSVGLPYWRAMQRVVLPQAIRTMIPSIINQFIITLKDTSILSVIGFPELVNTAKNVVAETFLSFQTWGIVAIMYLIVILLLQWLAKVLERRLKYESK